MRKLSLLGFLAALSFTLCCFAQTSQEPSSKDLQKQLDELKKFKEQQEKIEKEKIDATYIKYGDEVRIHLPAVNRWTGAIVYPSESFVYLSGNILKSGFENRYKTSFTLVSVNVQTKLGEWVRYGDKIMLKVGDLYVTRSKQWQLIYAMNCNKFGVGPKEQAAQFTIKGGPDKTFVMNTGGKNTNGYVELFLNETESLRWVVSFEEIYLAPQQWSIPIYTKSFYFKIVNDKK